MCNCSKINKSSAISVVAGNLQITFPIPVTLTNMGTFNFVICQCVPTAGLGLPVLLIINGQKIPLYNAFANFAVGADLKTRCMYKAYFGTGITNHIIATNLLSREYCCNRNTCCGQAVVTTGAIKFNETLQYTVEDKLEIPKIIEKK